MNQVKVYFGDAAGLTLGRRRGREIGIRCGGDCCLIPQMPRANKCNGRNNVISLSPLQQGLTVIKICCKKKLVELKKCQENLELGNLVEMRRWKTRRMYEYNFVLI